MRVNGEPLTPDESAAMIQAARALINVRFRHMGRKPAIGIDCSGLVLHALSAIGRPVQDVACYGRDPHKDGLREAVEANLGPAVDDAPKAGDVVLMSFDGEPRHVGLIADHPQGGLMLIHTYGQIRKVTEHALNAEWRSRIVSVYRP